MSTYLEHANLTVPDVDAAIQFLQTLEPEFVVRKEGRAAGSHRWVHVGTAQTYLALEEPHGATDPDGFRERYMNYGINHLGLVVPDLDATTGRLLAAGYDRGIEAPKERHRRRAYVIDAAGFEWELIQYLSQDPGERNLYE